MVSAPARSVPLFRPLTSPDIPQLVELESACFGADAWSESTWWSELAGRPRREYIVACHLEAPGLVQGYAGCDHGGETADVMTIAVAPSARGSGLGAALLSWLITTTAQRGASALLLEVRADNQPALGLYTGAGFAEISRRRRYYQPDGVDAVIMRRHLTTDDHTVAPFSQLVQEGSPS